MKTLLKDVKKVLDDASKTFNIPAHAVNQAQFSFVMKRRIKHSTLKLFTFGRLKAAVAPAPNTSKEEQRLARNLILKLVKGE